MNEVIFSKKSMKMFIHKKKINKIAWNIHCIARHICGILLNARKTQTYCDFTCLVQFGNSRISQKMTCVRKRLHYYGLLLTQLTMSHRAFAITLCPSFVRLSVCLSVCLSVRVCLSLRLFFKTYLLLQF